MSGADLRVDLTKASLASVVITSSHEGTQRRTEVKKTNLSGAWLDGANLSGLNLFMADLSGADMSEANLKGARLERTILERAQLRNVDLAKAVLMYANLREVDLKGADLREIRLSETNLQSADLRGANLSGAYLVGADLSGANLNDLVDHGQGTSKHVNLRDAVFEPVSVPRVETMADVEGLTSLQWRDTPHGLNLLREAFKKAGMRNQERQITYAIKRSEQRHLKVIERIFNYVLFEITCQYGMAPGRALRIILVLIFIFSIPYTVSVLFPTTGRSGIWQVWPEKRVLRSVGLDSPRLVKASAFRAPLYGLYFSLLSAFHIGWRDLNVGDWIARISPHDWTLLPTGWVKAISGLQSLISVYLIALWALTYFGRPFE